MGEDIAISAEVAPVTIYAASTPCINSLLMLVSFSAIAIIDDGGGW